MDRDTRLFVWLFSAALVSLFAVFLLYAVVFGPEAAWTLSRDTEDWARFGEYVGGTLGAVFGLLAFGGVLFSIREQRLQSRAEEFQRQMSSLSARVETLLSEGPAESGSEIRARIEALGVSLSVFSLLATIGNQAIAEPHENYLVQGRREQRRELILPTISRQLTVVRIELQHLVWCVERYLSMGGSAEITSLYRRKYQPVVCWMHVLDLVESDELRGFFNPEEFLAAIRSAPGQIEPPPALSSVGS